VGKLQNRFCLLIIISFYCSTSIYAGIKNCPKEAIHCVYAITNSPPKWIKIAMFPRNLSMILCLSNEDVVYLEKDDIEQDGTLPGTRLTWTLSQCENEQCAQSQLIGIDQFTLGGTKENYEAAPQLYGFVFNPAYGETCTFAIGKRHFTSA
jgi:hypothetical protein